MAPTLHLLQANTATVSESADSGNEYFKHACHQTLGVGGLEASLYFHLRIRMGIFKVRWVSNASTQSI